MSGAGQRVKDIKRNTFLNFKEARESESLGGLRKLFDKIDDDPNHVKFSVNTSGRNELFPTEDEAFGTR